MVLFHEIDFEVGLTECLHRFDPVPEAGISRGLDLILDAHTDLLTASSVAKPIQVTKLNIFPETKHLHVTNTYRDSRH